MTPTIPTVIDVREYPEFASGHIEGSLSIPLARLKEASAGWDRTMPLTLICKTGKRSHAARLQLMDMGFTSLNVLEGGIDAWRQAGKPLQFAAKQPWSLERQVRIAAGSLVLLTLALAQFISPWFLLGTAFVGAGLTFAGVSNICLMATLLGRLPWNRPQRGQCLST
jgi:rhodanese-related sulfurtransferase